MDTPTRLHRSPAALSTSRCRPEPQGTRIGIASCRPASLVPGAKVTPPAVLRVMHRIPGRVRVRIEGIEWTPHRVEQLMGKVALLHGVRSSRFTVHCASLTVVHVAAQESVLAEVRLILLQINVAPDLPARTPAAVLDPASMQARVASRRLVACAVVGLAIALMPNPGAPALIVLRLCVCAASMAVERHALTVTEPPLIARWLGMLAFLVSLARADNMARAFVSEVLGQIMKRPREALRVGGRPDPHQPGGTSLRRRGASRPGVARRSVSTCPA